MVCFGGLPFEGGVCAFRWQVGGVPFEGRSVVCLLTASRLCAVRRRCAFSKAGRRSDFRRRVGGVDFRRRCAMCLSKVVYGVPCEGIMWFAFRRWWCAVCLSKLGQGCDLRRQVGSVTFEGGVRVPAIQGGNVSFEGGGVPFSGVVPFDRRCAFEVGSVPFGSVVCHFVRRLWRHAWP